MMTKTFLYENTPISYRDLGSGSIVVLLHGFGEDSHIFNRQIEFLKVHSRLIVPDLPGSGNSVMKGDWFSKAIEMMASIDAMAKCIEALIKSITQEPVIMLGHSMGGYIALAIAEKYSDRLKAFGLLHSSAFADAEEKKISRKKSIGFIEKNGGYLFLKKSIPSLFGKKYQQEHANEIEGLVQQGKRFTKEALATYYVAMMNRPDRTLVLKSSKVPVLFIIGSEDIAAPMEDLLKQVHLPNVSYFHILNGVGHMGMLEATEQFNFLISKFISDIG